MMNLGNAVQACCGPGPDADDLAGRAVAEGEAALAAAGIPVVGVARGPRAARRPPPGRPGGRARAARRLVVAEPAARDGQHRDRLPQRRGGAARPAARRAHPGQRAAPGHRATAGRRGRRARLGPGRATCSRSSARPRARPRRASSTRKPLALASRVGRAALLPQPALQRVGAEVLADHQHRPAARAPAGAARSAAASCSASLPIRIGGLDQISSYVVVRGHVVRRRRREAVGHPERRGVLVGQQHRPLVDVDGASPTAPGHRRPRAPARSRRSRSRGRGSRPAAGGSVSRNSTAVPTSSRPCAKTPGARWSAPARGPTPRRRTGARLNATDGSAEK